MLSEIFAWGTECNLNVFQFLSFNVDELVSYRVTAACEVCYAVKVLLVL